jgi:hypothetical protein
VAIMSGGKLFLYGLMTGNLHIADTGSAFIHGAVDGTVINNGGYVEVFGTIGKAAGFGATHIAPSARVVR